MSWPKVVRTKFPFGGITVVFGGDFRQILPVIPKATRTEIVNSSIKRSYLWDDMNVIKLCQNMRLHREGCSTLHGELDVSIPHDILVEQIVDPIVDIVEATYISRREKYADPAYFVARAILAPLHETVSSINDYMLGQFLGEEVCYYNSNSIISDVVQPDMVEAEFPVEFLNSMKIGKFLDHELKLKHGAPVILLRNIEQSTGLCIGTRLIVKSLGTWSTEVEVLTGSHTGDRVFLPRIQFLIALCFAMIINKSQGQTLEEVGICLTRQIFTHGQLYVALSLVTKKSGLKISSCEEAGEPINFMKNIVFEEVLN
ncbi:ATP-dependent DNA helicase PIF1 [Linum perenne]